MHGYGPDDFYDDGVHPGGPDDTPDEYWDQQDFTLPDGCEAPPPASNAWGGDRGATAALIWERLETRGLA